MLLKKDTDVEKERLRSNFYQSEPTVVEKLRVMSQVSQSKQIKRVDDDHLQVCVVKEENGGEDEDWAPVEEGYGKPLHLQTFSSNILAEVKNPELILTACMI